jgi:hypothetical protein
VTRCQNCSRHRFRNVRKCGGLIRTEAEPMELFGEKNVYSGSDDYSGMFQ